MKTTMRTTATNVLNSLERTTLRNHMKTVNEGQQTCIKVGNALMAIRDHELFRETHKSFKAFCQEHWGFTDSRARQLIGGAVIATSIVDKSVTIVTPSRESQTRPLTQVPEEHRAEAWADAVESAGGEQPTAAQVEEAVERIKPPPKPKPKKPPVLKGDYGKCPNCLGTKWTEDEDGVSCAKCHHPHGESTGGVDEDRLKTQRQKTAKTVEALMRAFDDLQTMHAQTCKPCQLTQDDSKDPIRCSKRLLATAKGWK